MGREPLDPREGPTLWISDESGNDETFELITGTDPDDPTDTLVVSGNEIERAREFVNMSRHND